MGGRFVSIGECMIEMSGGDDDIYKLGFAGDTLNTAWYARAMLGTDWSVDYVTAVGDDTYSSRMLEFFEQHGIGTSAIRRIPGKRPGLYLIHQEHGDRQFTYWRENSAARMVADDAAALEASLAGADLIYFSGITLAILAPEARQRLFGVLSDLRGKGSKIAFDPNIRPVLWPDNDVLKRNLYAAAEISDFLLPTHPDEIPYFHDRTPLETAMRYVAEGAVEVAAKNGGGEAVIAHEGETHSVPAMNAEMIDATGAGDSFNGAYLAARLNGAGIEEAAQKAHALAAQVIGHKGALVDPELLKV